MGNRPSVRQWFFGDGAWGDIARDAWQALRGNPHRKPTRWGLSSVRIFKPRIGVATWLGRPRPARGGAAQEARKAATLSLRAGRRPCREG